jgi:hypothetical protein
MREEPHETPNLEEQPPRIGSWYLLTGLVLGILIGLIISLVLFPIRFRTIDPSKLGENYKATYRLMIANVYAATGDLDRAQQRIDLLADKAPISTLGTQAQRYLASGLSEDAQTLALLASALTSGVVPQETPENFPSTIESEAVPTQTLPPLTPIP